MPIRRNNEIDLPTTGDGWYVPPGAMEEPPVDVISSPVSATEEWSRQQSNQGPSPLVADASMGIGGDSEIKEDLRRIAEALDELIAIAASIQIDGITMKA